MWNDIISSPKILVTLCSFLDVSTKLNKLILVNRLSPRSIKNQFAKCFEYDTIYVTINQTNEQTIRHSINQLELASKFPSVYFYVDPVKRSLSSINTQIASQSGNLSTLTDSIKKLLIDRLFMTVSVNEINSDQLSIGCMILHSFKQPTNVSKTNVYAPLNRFSYNWSINRPLAIDRLGCLTKLVWHTAPHLISQIDQIDWHVLSSLQLVSDSAVNETSCHSLSPILVWLSSRPLQKLHMEVINHSVCKYQIDGPEAACALGDMTQLAHLHLSIKQLVKQLNEPIVSSCNQSCYYEPVLEHSLLDHFLVQRNWPRLVQLSGSFLIPSVCQSITQLINRSMKQSMNKSIDALLLAAPNIRILTLYECDPSVIALIGSVCHSIQTIKPIKTDVDYDHSIPQSIRQSVNQSMESLQLALDRHQLPSFPHLMMVDLMDCLSHPQVIHRLINQLIKFAPRLCIFRANVDLSSDQSMNQNVLEYLIVESLPHLKSVDITFNCAINPSLFSSTDPSNVPTGPSSLLYKLARPVRFNRCKQTVKSSLNPSLYPPNPNFMFFEPVCVPLSLYQSITEPISHAVNGSGDCNVYLTYEQLIARSINSSITSLNNRLGYQFKPKRSRTRSTNDGARGGRLDYLHQAFNQFSDIDRLVVRQWNIGDYRPIQRSSKHLVDLSADCDEDECYGSIDRPDTQSNEQTDEEDSVFSNTQSSSQQNHKFLIETGSDDESEHCHLTQRSQSDISSTQQSRQSSQQANQPVNRQSADLAISRSNRSMKRAYSNEFNRYTKKPRIDQASSPAVNTKEKRPNLTSDNFPVAMIDPHQQFSRQPNHRINRSDHPSAKRVGFKVLYDRNMLIYFCSFLEIVDRFVSLRPVNKLINESIEVDLLCRNDTLVVELSNLTITQAISRLQVAYRFRHVWIYNTIGILSRSTTRSIKQAISRLGSNHKLESMTIDDPSSRTINIGQFFLESKIRAIKSVIQSKEQAIKKQSDNRLNNQWNGQRNIYQLIDKCIPATNTILEPSNKHAVSLKSFVWKPADLSTRDEEVKKQPTKQSKKQSNKRTAQQPINVSWWDLSLFTSLETVLFDFLAVSIDQTIYTSIFLFSNSLLN